MDGEVVFRYHTYTAFMADSYSDWIVHLERPCKISPFLRFIVAAMTLCNGTVSTYFGYQVSMGLRMESLNEKEANDEV